MRYCEFKQKTVINIIEGRQLGYVTDIIFDECTGRICSIIVPGCPGIKTMFRSKGLIIPWSSTVKIGGDVILVEADPSAVNSAGGNYK